MSGIQKKRTVIEAAICAAAAFLSYANALGGGFVWDDIYLVLKNPYIKGIDNIAALFTSGYWASIGKTGGLYRPLTMLSFLIENSVAGSSPWLYHLDNILLHALAATLVYLVAGRLLSDVHSAAPLFAGLLFAVHPVHVEAVSWISGRAELLSAVFFLSAFLAFLHPTRRFVRREVSAVLFLLGLLCKETSVMLPVIVILYLVIIGKERGLKHLAVSVAPYLIVLAAYIPVRLTILRGHIGPQFQMFGAVDGYHTFLTMMKAGFQYVRLTLFPADLRVAYIFPPPGTILDYQVILFITLLIALIALSGRLNRAYPLTLFLILWFVVALLPVSNLIPTEVIMTERALYLPSVGVCILIGTLFASALSADRRITAVSAAIVMVLMAAITISRTPVWCNQELFTKEQLILHEKLVEDFPEEPAAYVKLADSYMALGDARKAGPLYEKALELDPADCGAHYGLANSLRSVGRLDKALDELFYALDCGYDRPADIHGNIGAILMDIGRPEEAEKHILIALELAPDNAGHHLNHGLLLAKTGDFSGALKEFVTASRLDPGMFDAYFQQGIIYGIKEDYGSAVDVLTRAVELEPDNPEAHLYLGAAYEGLGEHGRAEHEYSIAGKLSPGNGSSTGRAR